MVIGLGAELIITVVLVTMLSNITEVNARASRGFRGDLVETMRKSRHKIVHTIQVRSSVS